MRTEHPKRAAPATGRTEPFLKLSGIAVAYGGIRAIKGISLEVKQGEIVSMIGANGAGKTTTLKTIMRLLPLASGTIEFAGRLLNDVDTESVVDLGICLVPEGRAIFPNLTVRENLEMGAYNHRDAKTIRESIEDVIQARGHVHVIPIDASPCVVLVVGGDGEPWVPGRVRKVVGSGDEAAAHHVPLVRVHRVRAVRGGLAQQHPVMRLRVQLMHDRAAQQQREEQVQLPVALAPPHLSDGEAR